MPSTGAGLDQRAMRADLAPRRSALPSAPNASTAPIDQLDSPTAQLALAYHRRWVRGEIGLARRGLASLVGRDDAPDLLRARAALWLSEIAHLCGNKRAALEQLEVVKRLAGQDASLARQARERRARIVTRAPLADVRGPVPGSLRLGESPQVKAMIRRAEQQLVAFYRYVVRWRLESMDRTLLRKQALLGRAVARYEKVETLGGPAAKAAARFRIAAMYHHMAEALTSELPKELNKEQRRKSTRKLQGLSVAYLGRALSAYRAVARVAGGQRWKQLAQREAQSLGRLLGGEAKGKSKRR